MPSYPPSFALAVYLIRSFIRRSWDGRKPRRWLLCRSSDRPPEAISSWVRSTRHVLNLVHELEAKGAALTVLEPAFSTKDAAGPIHVTCWGWWPRWSASSSASASRPVSKPPRPKGSKELAGGGLP